MNNRKCSLTELEGAVLAEIQHRGMNTTFKVRRAFQLSHSAEWSGSAGAVYPAIRRLADAGIVDMAPPQAGRRTRLLSLTAKGRTMLEDWFCDVRRAANLGADPFRLRAGLWATLPRDRREQLFAALRSALHSQAEAYRTDGRERDATEQVSIDVALETQQWRLAWLDACQRRWK